MAWIPISAWIAAVVIAVVVLGFCAYDLLGKTRRLRGDLGRLQELNAQVVQLQQGLTAAQRRLADTGLEPSGRPTTNNG